MVPVPVESSGPSGTRDLAAIAYAANPRKKGLDRVLTAWRAARREGETLVVAGVAGADADGVSYTGMIAPAGVPRAAAPRARLRRGSALRGVRDRAARGARGRLPARDDAAPGGYAALPLARALDPRLVGDDLARASRVALDDPAPGYAERARAALAPFSPAAVDELVRERLLPALVNGGH